MWPWDATEMTSTKSDQTQGTSTERLRLVAFTRVLVAVVVFSIPLFSSNVIDSRGSIVLAIGVGPILLLLILVVLQLPRSSFGIRWSAAVVILAAVPVLMAIAGLFHSTVEGWSSVTFAAAASAAGFAIWVMDREDVKRFVAVPLLAAATIQAFLASAQLWTGDGIVPTLIANDIGVKVIDGIARPQGTMNHVYGLAALGLLALAAWVVVRRKDEASGLSVLLAVAATSSLIAMTFSRSALIGVVAIAVIMGISALRGDRGAAVLAGVIAVAYVATMLVTLPSWTARADQTVSGDLDDASLGRLTLAVQAIDLIKSEPFTGVGPGRYEATLIERDMLDEDYPYIVHNYPLAFAVENGAGAGLAIAMLLVWLGVVAVRAGPSRSAAFFGLLPLLMLDVMHYGVPVGQLMLGVWLGILAASLRWPTADGSLNLSIVQRSRR